MMPSEFTASPTATPHPPSVRIVLVCDTQPVLGAGVKALFNGHPELRFAESTDSLLDALDVIRETPVDLVVLDKAFGMRAIEEWLSSLKESGFSAPGIVVWGATISAADTMRLLKAGARGVLLKTADISSLVSCLRAVALGRHWVEDCMLRDQGVAYPRNTLSPREQEVLELVQQGLANKAIAQELQIQPGTVKIHMKHIFEKTGVRGRHALALAEMIGNRATRPPMHSAAAA
jgi:DNA-binding NarL/FixJ family response regulator